MYVCNFLFFFQVQDSIPFSIGLSSDEGSICAASNGILFPKGQPIPSVKVLTFQRSNLFHLEAFYANINELPPGTSPKISCFTVCSMPILKHLASMEDFKSSYVHLNIFLRLTQAYFLVPYLSICFRCVKGVQYSLCGLNDPYRTF